MAKPYMCGDETPIYVPSGGCDCNYTVHEISSIGYASSYGLFLNGEQVGDNINIPLDKAVDSGSINTVVVEDAPYDGAVIGDKYLLLTFQNSDTRVYVPMKDLMSGGYIVVDELPQEGNSQYVYLVPAGDDTYDQYVYVNGEWINIGSSSVDLSNYYNKSQIDTKLLPYISENASGDVSIRRDLIIGRNTYAQNVYTTNDTLSLGAYVAVGCLTSNTATLRFVVPTGRVYPPGTTISNISFEMEARASSSAGTGVYIITSQSSQESGAGYVYFDSSENCSFRVGGNVGREMTPSMYNISLQGQTNMYIEFATNTTNFFAGTTTISSQINNNTPNIRLRSIVVQFSIPS